MNFFEVIKVIFGVVNYRDPRKIRYFTPKSSKMTLMTLKKFTPIIFGWMDPLRCQIHFKIKMSTKFSRNYVSTYTRNTLFLGPKLWICAQINTIVIKMDAILNFLQIFVSNIIITVISWLVQVQYKTSQVKSVNINIMFRYNMWTKMTYLHVLIYNDCGDQQRNRF